MLSWSVSCLLCPHFFRPGLKSNRFSWVPHPLGGVCISAVSCVLWTTWGRWFRWPHHRPREALLQITQGHCLNPQFNKSGSHEDVHLFFFMYSLLQIYPQSLRVAFSSHKSPIEIRFIFWLVNVSLVNQTQKISPVYENQARVGISRPLADWLHPQNWEGSPLWSWGTWPSVYPYGHK